MTGRIILLRHGQTTSNVGRFLDTAPPGAELTDFGRGQAVATGLEIARMVGAADGSVGSLAAMYCSIALRAQQTAMLVAGAIESHARLPRRSIAVFPRLGLHEVSAGEWEMRGDAEANAAYLAAQQRWFAGEEGVHLAGGESYAEILARYVPVLEEIVDEHLADPGSEDRDVVVVTHGTVMRTVARAACGLDAEFACSHYVANCQRIVLEPNGEPFGRWGLLAWGD
ncbi:histidine phosphatase family protein [Corynebacterium uterequi]|uniref:Fructose-2,6-bisphosphatase n=1 Tax=Corynebacterium uterequi TaxID=1072256 RepID=A0A0G3HFI3_9CORY|nr:histidine phosphatase family protein [Corynebacterium uterequi]AKK12074.1 fructose-2,6-bisphosphatase [Corynebacterium uterequi]